MKTREESFNCSVIAREI